MGPGQEVSVISDRHQSILNVVQERIPGYGPQMVHSSPSRKFASEGSYEG
jgi:hypothetical protein